jgi:hypothetical protein
MAFVTTYQLVLKNNEDQVVEIIISDTTSGTTGTPLFIPLVCGGFSLIVVNDSDDKFSIIKGKRIEFSFVSTLTYGLSTFTSAVDNQWLVEAFINSVPIFSGYLVTDATREAFLPRGTYGVQLTASDNIALLKNLPLTKPDNTNPRGMFRLIDYISWCLRKTGFDFPINVAFNLLTDNLVLTDHAYDKVYLHSKSFEAEINTSIDCYSVLEHILKGCFLTQEGNEWWIVRIDEMNGDPLRVAHYSFDGVLGSIDTVTLSKNIGRTESIKFFGKDAEVNPERPVLFDKLKYRFEFPREIIDNIDFARGTTWVSPYVVDMSFFIKAYANLGSFPTPGEFNTIYKSNATSLYYKWTGATYVQVFAPEIPTGKAYIFEDWTLGRIDSGSVAISAYVIKVEQFSDEKARYLLLTNGVGFHYVKSNRVPVGRFDKFTLSVDRRLTSNVSGSGQTTEFVAQVRLYGEDGTFWTVTSAQFGSDAPGTWVQSNSTFTTNQRNITVQYVRNQINETDWMTASVDANPVPVNGEIEVLLFQQTVHGTGIATHFANLQFQYNLYINGTYQKYTGQYNKVSQAISTKANLEDDINLSDAPHKLLKGSMQLKTAGGQYYLTSNWYNFNAGTTGELAIASFGKYQAFEYWNQNRREIRKIQGSLIGLDSATQLPGLLHIYNITTVNEHSTNKKFLLLSYSQDLDTCKWTAVFAEVLDTVQGKIYNSTHEFKYTSE